MDKNLLGLGIMFIVLVSLLITLAQRSDAKHIDNNEHYIKAHWEKYPECSKQ